MLFDLQGRRRRVVQVTYVGLALLMGGGLVLSGIGSDARGGLLDAFVGDGDSRATSDAKKPFENADRGGRTSRSRRTRKDPAALADLVRAHFALAGLEQDETTTGRVSISDEGKEQLSGADAAWTPLPDHESREHRHGPGRRRRSRSTRRRRCRRIRRKNERTSSRRADRGAAEHCRRLREPRRSGDEGRRHARRRPCRVARPSPFAADEGRQGDDQGADRIGEAGRLERGAGGNGAAPPAGGP